ncbi:MAG: translation initiation factor IF-2 [Lewinellaceae bacterium]|nr:translation initiation factor IF-2 [Saprospiraceae bacterium]MCB9337750.1 translation initiation factor IF-2 [Lewinellaceae bacterium]
MEKRLVKVAQELNVGTSTIVDFLSGKGFDVDNKPTTKITDEMQALLQREFQKSIDIKEQAEKLTIGVRPILKKELSGNREDSISTTTLPPLPSLKKEPLPKKVLPEPEPEEVMPPPAEPVAEPVQPEEVVEIEKPTIGLTIKGKIDLDQKGRPVKEKKEAPAPEPAPQEPEPAVPDTPAEQPAMVEEPQEDNTPAPSATPEKERTAPGKPAKEMTEDVAEVVDDELVRMQAPELRGLKILGKIDIQKKSDSRGKKKKKPEKGKEPEPEEGSAAPARGGTGRPDNRRPKPVASSDSEDAKKRKRKRKKVPTTSAPGSDDNRGASRAGVGRRRRDEVSGKEVDEQIKKTMATISGAGKKKRQKLRRETRERVREKQEMRDMEEMTDKLEVTEFVTVQELANMMDVSASEVITTCMSLGVFVSINQRLDAELIELVASEFGHEVEFISVEEQTDVEEEEEDAPEDLLPRAPVVTVMGHVDHGKTSLLDHIRKANVVEGEAGGITQHIGAYDVEVEGRKITFLDTPGHEAFTAMRARGTKVTDIAIIVIAADDNVMPQTKEAISHAQAAGVPMVFAINKIDKAGAAPERIKQELASMNLLVEDWGGTYQSHDISAKAGTGIDALLEKVLFVADLADLKANPNRLSSGTIIEASLDKGKGYVAKMLVQNGTLHVGDAMVAGEYSGKVKAMYNERGKKVEEAGPSTAVLVLGLSGAPQAGERYKVMEDESEARQLAARRAQINREQSTRATKRISLDEIGRRLALGTFRELNLIVKGDVDGSVEALSDSLIKLSLETVQVNVIHRAVGQIVESDVLLASASDAIIIGFQVRPSLAARKLAEREGVEIKTYSIIYEVIEEIKLAIEGLLEPTKEEKIVCNVEVREVYKISKIGTVAGCYVMDGKITRNTHIRIIRDGIVIYPTREGAHGELGSLKRFKEDAKEVKSGTECGITIKNFNDLKVGDVIEGYEITEVKQKYGK